MNKLKLNLDEIKVESFETVNTNGSKGTILGQLEATGCCEGGDTNNSCGGGGSGVVTYPLCSGNDWTCFGQTCDRESCMGTCNEFTCGNTCPPIYSCEFTQCGQSCGCTNPYGESDCCLWMPTLDCTA